MKQRSAYRVCQLLSAALLVCLAWCDVSLPSGPGLFSPRSGGTAASPSVSGVVTDASDGNPIQNARIVIDDGPSAGSSTTTDTDGRYMITVPRGTVTVRASHSGYTSQTARVTVSSSTKLNFRLAPLAGATAQAGGVSE